MNFDFGASNFCELNDRVLNRLCSNQSSLPSFFSLSSFIMQASSERITSLCTNLGRQTNNGYVPSDDCQINLDELAFSIWRDDEAQRNVASQCYSLGVFKRDFIPLLLTDGPLSYIALKALTAITYPPSANAEEYDKHIEILAAYKSEVSYRPEMIAKALENCISILENPRAEEILLNKAELAMTFIRNIAIIPSPPDVHDRIFKIFNDQLLFDVIDMLKLTRFGDRAIKFAKIISGIFYGCFVPYLPLKKADPEKPSALSAFLESQQSRTAMTSSRHGHWNSSVTIKGKGQGYTIPLSLALSQKTKIPQGKHLVSRSRPVEKVVPKPLFTKVAEEAAIKMMNSPNFPIIFDFSFPRTFSAYDKLYSVREQLQLIETLQFFYDFTLKYGVDPKTNPLLSPKVISYVISMFTFFSEAPTLVIENITSIQAMHSLCKTVSALCSFLIMVVQSDASSITDQQIARDIISRTAADLENLLVNFLCMKNLSKKSNSVLKDNIIALERLYKLYAIAEEEKLVRYKLTRRDEDADPDDPDADRIEEDVTQFSSDTIVKRLARRQGVLKPFFIILSCYDSLDEEIVSAMTTMLKRFSSTYQGLAHLFTLPNFYIINRLFEDKVLEKLHLDSCDELNRVLQNIVKKFFDKALIDKTLFLQLIPGCDVPDLIDVEYLKKIQEDNSNERLGLSQDINEALSIPIGEDDLTLPPTFDLPPLKSRQEIYEKIFEQRRQQQLREQRIRKPKKLPSSESSDDLQNIQNETNKKSSDSDSDELDLEQFRKAAKNKSQSKLVNLSSSESSDNILNIQNESDKKTLDSDSDELDLEQFRKAAKNRSQNASKQTTNKLLKVLSDNDSEIEKENQLQKGEIESDEMELEDN